jgi:two-component system sensor kinase FixL
MRFDPSARPATAGLLGVAYVGAYVMLDAFSFVEPVLKLGITPWNPQAGLTVAFLLWRGWRQAAWTVLAAFLAEIVVRGGTAPVGMLALASLAIGGGYGALGFALSRQGFSGAIESRRQAAMLVLGAGATALVVAYSYVGVFVVAEALPRPGAAAAVARYWVGDVNGVATLTPLLFAVGRWRAFARAVSGRTLLCLGQAGLLVGTLAFVFGQPRPEELQFVYVLFVPVIWISLTWGVVGATAATLAVQLGLMAGVQRGLAETSVVEVQFLLMSLATTALLMGAVVAERARALTRVAAREAEQRALVASAPDAVLTSDANGTVTSANAVAARLMGQPAASLVGTRVQNFIGDFSMSSNGGRAAARVLGAQGTSTPVDVAWMPLEPPAGPGFLLVIRDVSEREHAQAQLRDRDTALARAMRFALAGELATALTHELNQPITALVSYLRAVEILAAPIVGRDPRLEATLTKANREAHRAADVLRRLRDFYRMGTSSIGEVALDALVDEVMSAYAERAASLRVELSRDLAAIGAVHADPTQLQMVLHNLVANSLDALASAEEPRRILVSARPGEAVQLVVEDTGRGIDPDVGGDVFEPFVTDKAGGMGLGLTISRSLMRAQGGDLRLESTGCAGTRFVVDLPRVTQARAVA